MAEKTVAFILARLNSSRMPAKHFRYIGNKTMIKWVIDQLKSCAELDQIVIATLAEPGNEPLQNLAAVEGIACFCYEGEADHVTTRLCRAAEHYGADIGVLVSGDCPLIYGPVIDILLNSFKKEPKADVLRVDSSRQTQPVALYGVDIARLAAWQKGDELSDRPELKEHHFPAIELNLDKFVVHNCALPAQFYAPPHRLFVDIWADLEFCNTLYDRLHQQDLEFNLPNVLTYLENHEEIKDINRHVYQRGLQENIKKVLLIVDVGAVFGYGHLRRSLELALQVVERLSWPVTFLADDIFAKKLIEERGFKVQWGAFNRPVQPATEKLSDQPEYNGYDLVILDLAKRPITISWRDDFLAQIPVLVLDKLVEWCLGADAVIVPGVTVSPKSKIQWQQRAGSPRLHFGRDHLIIRREIRYAAKFAEEKIYDLLIYVHDHEMGDKIARVAGGKGLTVCLVDGTSADFPMLLAKSRYYLGAFGYSFYEALFLSTRPVALVEDQVKTEDVELFYEAFGLQRYLFDPNQDFIKQYNNWLDRADNLESIQLEDGTPAVVELVAVLAKGEQADESS